MADERTYFAQLDDDNTVIRVAVVTAEFMAENPDRYQGRWVQTWRDREDKTYAGPNAIYDEATQDFSWPALPEVPAEA